MRPSSRQELIDYCLRQLGAPVLEVNVAEEQIEDLVDDALQFFNERHFDGVQKTFLKYQITQEDKDRGLARPPGAPAGNSGTVGIASTSNTTTIVGTATTFTYYENSNYISLPEEVIGVEKVFKYDDTMGKGMFNIKYQLMLNDMFGLLGFGASGYDLTTYSMTMGYLETMDFLLNTHKHIRFNRRSDRMYLDLNWDNLDVGEFLVLECYSAMNANEYSRVWNDSFLKPYLTALIKRQWGMNLIKFQGVKLPGGIEFNGRQIYDDAEKDLERIRERMTFDYELPPMDLIG